MRPLLLNLKLRKVRLGVKRNYLLESLNVLSCWECKETGAKGILVQSILEKVESNNLARWLILLTCVSY